jgi:Tfp pilus assembly protein PilF
MHVIHEVPRERRRLESWKEIAAFFDRDERTVKRWEKEKGLPVHRMPENVGARVFAYTDELQRWMNAPEAPATKPVASEPIPSPDEPAEQPPADVHRQRPKITTLAVVASVLIGAVLLATLFRGRSHSEVGKSNQPSSTNGESASSASTRHTVDPVARELYLNGRYHWDKRTPEDLNQAVNYYNQAIARDPNYAEAYVGLANCYSLLREFSAMPSEEAFPKALAAARKAIALDDSSAEAHTALAMVTFYWNWDAAGAEREFRRAIELNPSYVTAHHWYATFLMALGRFPEALEQIDRARQLEPASTAVLADRGLILYHSGQRDQALALLQQLAKSQPDFFSTRRYLSLVYLTNDDYPQYLKEMNAAAALSRDKHEIEIAQAAENGYRSGGRERMFQNMVGLQKKYFDDGTLQAFFVADTYANMGDKEEALRYLKTSFQRHEVAFMSIRVHESFFFLHGDPQFQQLIEQAGLPPLNERAK